MSDNENRGLICDGALVLHGDVGFAGWSGIDGFSAADVIFGLAQLGPKADVTVRINSVGGNAIEGAAIHAVLLAHRGKITTVVEGIAASAASIIAMAASERIIAPGSMMMVHDPACLTIGTVEDHEDTIGALTTLAGSMASIYAAATGRPAAEILSEMKDELWLDAETAVAKGYATKIGTAPVAATTCTPFPIAAYAKAPRELVALAASKGWNAREFTASHALGRAAPMPAKPEAATQIRDMVATMRTGFPGIPEDFAATLIAEKKTPDQARVALFEKMAEADATTAISTARGERQGTKGMAMAVMKRQLKARGITPADEAAPGAKAGESASMASMRRLLAQAAHGPAA